MTPEEVDQIVAICSDACKSETGKLLYAAIVTNGLMNRILDGHPDPHAVADELSAAKIAQLAENELELLSASEKKELLETALEYMQRLVTDAGKAGFRAMRNGILSSDQLTPALLVNAAALACAGSGDS